MTPATTIEVPEPQMTHGHSHLGYSYGQISFWANLVAGFIYAVTKAFVDAYIIAEMAHYIMNHQEFDEKIEKGLYWSGFVLSLLTGLINIIAIFYYKNTTAQANLHGSSNDHGHSHDNASHHHSWSQFFAELFGLKIFTFAIAMGGIYYAFLGKKSPENVVELVVAVLLMIIGGLANSYGESNIHHFFVQHSEREDGNFFFGFFKLMFVEFPEIYRTEGFLSMLKNVLLRWLSFFSHISSALFGIGAALTALQLLTSTPFPIYITFPVILFLSLIGSMVHNNSELRAFIENGANVTGLFENTSVLSKIFMAFSLLLLVFHVLPEAIGIPELITNDSVSLMGRVLIVLAFVATLGVADLLVNFALMKKPLEDLMRKLFPNNETYPLLGSRRGSTQSGPEMHLQQPPPPDSYWVSLTECFCPH